MWTLTAMLIWAALLLLLSVSLGGLTIWLARLGNIGVDESHRVQKVHEHWVPRLGGVPLFLTYVSGCLLWVSLGYLPASAAGLILCSIPAFALGLAEDVFRNTGVGLRLFAAMLSAVLSWFFLDAQIRHLDLPLIDDLLAYSAVASLILTATAVGGVVHAINIIDGYNGLCGFFSLIAFASIGLIAGMHADWELAQLAALACLCTAGFLLWNYPMGKLFMGDAGAYFVGFLIAEFSILLVTRNPAVSPWAAMLIVIYPVWETLFSMLRRATSRGFSQVGSADALHLHHLVFGRLVRSCQHDRSAQARILSNAMTTPYLIALVVMSVVPAIVFSDDTVVLIGFCLLFIFSYRLCYVALVRFRAPRWLAIRRRRHHKVRVLPARQAKHFPPSSA